MHSLPTTKSLRPRPIKGWALRALIEFDEARPGTLRFALSASALRRQTFFLTLSLIQNGADEVATRLKPLLSASEAPNNGPLAHIASVLVCRRVRDIVSHLYGRVEGLVGALSRIGDDPLLPAEYRRIVAVLSEPEHQGRARVLRQLPRITSSMISVLLALRPPFVLRELVECFQSVADVHQFEAAISLIRNVQLDVTDRDLAQSIKALGHDADLGSWVSRMIGKASRFPVVPPVHDDPDFIWLHSGAAMQEAGKRFENCLRTKIPLCALGRFAYLEYRPSPAIVALESLSGGHFVLDSFYAARNGRVEADVAHAIRRKLEGRGVLLPARFAHGHPFNSVAKMIGFYDFERHLQALEDWTDDHDLQVIGNEFAREFGLV